MPSEFNFLPRKKISRQQIEVFFFRSKKIWIRISYRGPSSIQEFFFGCWFRLVAFLIHFLLWHLGQNNASICIHLRLCFRFFISNNRNRNIWYFFGKSIFNGGPLNCYLFNGYSWVFFFAIFLPRPRWNYFKEWA